MRESLFDQFRPVVLTSATMTTGGSFEFLIERLGLGAPLPEVVATEAENGVVIAKIENPPVPETPTEEVRTLTLGSPFNFRKNALVYIAQDLPDPTTNVTFWEEAAVKRAAEVVKRTDGRAFILCTSFRMVDQVARFLEKVMPERIRILKQGGMARGQLLSEFRRDISSVLVGTTSFWQGVDVPGESLSCVIILKLPFAVPDEPLGAGARRNHQKTRARCFQRISSPASGDDVSPGFWPLDSHSGRSGRRRDFRPAR
jgi:ATP-dependent DNA helicase DinG